MDKFILVVSYLAVLSVAVERFVQLLKVVPVVKRLSDNAQVVQGLAAVVGFFLSYMVGPKYLNTWIPNQWLEYFITGLLVSGGSGVWHDALQIFQDMKKSLPSGTKGS